MRDSYSTFKDMKYDMKTNKLNPLWLYLLMSLCTTFLSHFIKWLRGTAGRDGSHCKARRHIIL